MSEHPAPFRLEALMVGESDPEAESHLQTCSTCRGYVDDLRTERTSMLNELPAAEFLERPELVESFQKAEGAPAPWSRFKFWFPMGILAATAVLMYASIRAPNPTRPGPQADQILMKGAAIQAALIRKRGTRQSRHSHRVTVRAHDALRVEVTVAKPTVISVGILTADRVWHPVATGLKLEPGTHLVHSDSILIDETPTAGRLLVGPPKVVQRAVKGERAVGLTEVAIDYEELP